VELIYEGVVKRFRAESIAK